MLSGGSRAFPQGPLSLEGCRAWGVESQAGVFPCLITAAHEGALLLHGLFVGCWRLETGVVPGGRQEPDLSQRIRQAKALRHFSPWDPGPVAIVCHHPCPCVGMEALKAQRAHLRLLMSAAWPSSNARLSAFPYVPVPGGRPLRLASQ